MEMTVSSWADLQAALIQAQFIAVPAPWSISERGPKATVSLLSKSGLNQLKQANFLTSGMNLGKATFTVT